MEPALLQWFPHCVGDGEVMTLAVSIDFE